MERTLLSAKARSTYPPILSRQLLCAIEIIQEVKLSTLLEAYNIDRARSTEHEGGVRNRSPQKVNWQCSLKCSLK